MIRASFSFELGVMSMKLEQAVFDLMEVMMQNVGLQGIVDKASRILERPIWVMDLRYRFLTDPESVFPVSKKVAAEYQTGVLGRSSLLLLHQKKLIEEIDCSRRPYIFFDEALGIRMVATPVRVKGIVVARLASCEIDRPLTEFDLSLLDKLKDLVSLEFQRGDYGADRLQTEFSYMMSELLERKCTTMPHIFNYMEARGYTLNADLWLAVIYVPDKAIKAFPWYTVAEQLALAFPNSIYADFEGSLVLLINQKREITPAQIHEFSYVLRECNLRAAISYCFHDLAKCYCVYHDTRSLIYAVSRTASERTCVRYEDHIPELAASLLAGKIDPHSIAGDAVGKMIDCDQKYGQEAMVTMKAYVRCAFNIKRTAAMLHIHENTVRYRVSRIAELTGLDYENGKTAFELILAFALLDAGLQE